MSHCSVYDIGDQYPYNYLGAAHILCQTPHTHALFIQKKEFSLPPSPNNNNNKNIYIYFDALNFIKELNKKMDFL